MVKVSQETGEPLDPDMMLEGFTRVSGYQSSAVIYRTRASVIKPIKLTRSNPSKNDENTCCNY